MSIRVGKWRVKLRGRPVGQRALSNVFLFSGVTFFFFPALLIAVFLQSRLRIAAIIDKAFRGMQEQECAACGGPDYLGWIVLAIVLAGFAISFRSRAFRYLVFGYLLPGLGAFAVTLLGASIFVGVRGLGVYLGLIGFIAFAVICSLLKIEKVTAQPLPGQVRQWLPKK